jgi:hypothetical protein
VLKNYLLWTHERGSVHYDVMVTIILAFIFLTPRFIHYGDAPKSDWPVNEIRMAADSAGHLICVVPAEMVPGKGTGPSNQDLDNAIARVAGSVTVDRWQPVKEIGGSIVAWRVWAHR